MADLAAKKSNFISRSRQAFDAFIQAYAAIRAVGVENVTTGLNAALVDGDFVGDNDHLTAADLQAAFTSFSTLQASVNEGGAGALANFLKLKR